jgi:hypothetical protein
VKSNAVGVPFRYETYQTDSRLVNLHFAITSSHHQANRRHNPQPLQGPKSWLSANLLSAYPKDLYSNSVGQLIMIRIFHSAAHMVPPIHLDPILETLVIDDGLLPIRASSCAFWHFARPICHSYAILASKSHATRTSRESRSREPWPPPYLLGFWWFNQGMFGSLPPSRINDME